ncbi:hypothetical protein DD237_000444 [Peronospora effusa]|uniref:Uncharacterized protein n=1 Tax=Peronospora effusa TaxID=542832 RepID=A0A3R7W7S6_9STRA|nr:hypothetical protein DD237_000444 [Peronospora effusa]
MHRLGKLIFRNMFCKVAWNELGDDEAPESTMVRILGCCEDCDNQVATAWGSNASTKAFTLLNPVLSYQTAMAKFNTVAPKC